MVTALKVVIPSIIMMMKKKGNDSGKNENDNGFVMIMFL